MLLMYSNSFPLLAGSVLAVTVSDPYAAGRKNRFLGICIQRDGTGLKHRFTLRNCLDGMGVSVFLMYLKRVSQERLAGKIK